ncbi:hypothetical protein ABB37_02090 [Leptomonas pyrrhocoris]|uniref:Uncharacterized protein n=1 Tax=Leptomonas pyrrhocoris TaxID=157538 RepID=A0A0M9G773_LEPPY|nr:hypothetical protein ABB37_02090 [Leptomonas pyrrhocoris]KPA83927.1 hypothetical protein ABB37_02090 [Leptomonas pyrrhocoris]|eukprot:XP_015662366.1 hypothetical protein ABB37_02090 [Leptomonas pyrrhocoris]
MAAMNQAGTFAEAGVTLHRKLSSALQSAAAATAAAHNSNPGSNGGASLIAPTPLLVRVLRRTATDFSDVIVDGRCATGSRQVGSAAAVWVHHNAALRGTGANSSNTSPSTIAATSAAGGASGSGGGNNTNSGVPSPSPSGATATTANSDGVIPLYYTEAALNECRNLLALYSFHCLLTASQLYNSSVGNASHHVLAAADGRVHQLPVNANHWAPEVSLIIAETEASAEELLKVCRALAEACNYGVNVSMAIGSKTPASLIVRPVSAAGSSAGAGTPTGASSAATGGAGGKDDKTDAEAGKNDEVKKRGTEWPYAASVVITTTHSFLNWNLVTLLNTGVDVAVAEDGGEAEAGNKDSNENKERESAAVRTKRVFPHITSLVVEEIGRSTTAGTASAEKALQQWRDAHAVLHSAMPRQHTRYCAAAHLLPHVLWICRGPVSRLPASLRHLLSRRSRRYYQLLPSTYISAAAVSLMPQPQEGLSTPAESLGVRLVLSQSTADKDAQLRRIVTDRSGLYHRVLILTHNKEVPQLNTLITSWGVSREFPSSSSNTNGKANNASGATPPAVTEASPNLVYSTRRMDSVLAQHQCHSSFLNSSEAAERAASTSSGAGDAAPSASPVVVTLVAWDAFTALDVMDVDVIIQYYPPQKSLTEQEWAEFIQLLHTTVDGEREIELSLRQNKNNKEANIRAKLAQLMQATTTGAETSTAAAAAAPAPSRTTPSTHRPLPVLVTLMVAADFTLTAYFLHQYLYSGATGVLTQAATATSLASVVPAPGRPGMMEAVKQPMPVLDISPRHPYFIPLVCGHDGRAEWPAEAAGSPPRARADALNAKPSDAAPLRTRLASGEAVTIRNVLAAKLAKEQGPSATSKSPPASGTTTTTSPTRATTVSPILLLAQGNVASSTGGGGGGGGGSSSSSGAGGKGAAPSTVDNNNSNVNNTNTRSLARLVAKNGMNASSSSNLNSGGAVGSGSGINLRAQGAKEAARSPTEAGAPTSTTTNGSGSSGNNTKGSGNSQKSNNNSKGNNNNNTNKGGPGNANSHHTNTSPTASSSAAPAVVGNTGGGQTGNKSPVSTATSPSAKTGSGEKSGGGGGGGGGNNKRRQRSNRGGNNNNSKKAAAQPSN